MEAADIRRDPVELGSPLDKEHFDTIIASRANAPAVELIHNGTLEVTVPCRVHLSVMDMRCFSPGQPGGGGVGFAVGLPAKLKVTPSNTWSVDSERHLVIEHIAKLIAKAAGYEGAFSIQADDHGIRHLGLGSTTTIMTATAVAVNHILGKPLDFEQIRFLIGRNFVEEENGQLFPAFETGVGPACILYGGFVALEDGLELVDKAPFGAGKTVVLAIPVDDHPSTMEEEDLGKALVNQNSGEEEALLLMSKGRDGDDRDAARKREVVREKLIPALKSEDIPGVGASIDELQSLGSKVAEIEHHAGGVHVRKLMAAMKDKGALVVGMSSVGPTVVGVFDGFEGGLEGFASRTIVTSVDNTGPVVKLL